MDGLYSIDLNKAREKCPACGEIMFDKDETCGKCVECCDCNIHSKQITRNT